MLHPGGFVAFPSRREEVLARSCSGLSSGNAMEENSQDAVGAHEATGVVSGPRLVMEFQCRRRRMEEVEQLETGRRAAVGIKRQA